MTAAHYKGGHPPGNDLGLHYTALPPIVASCPYSDQLLVTRKFWSPGANRPSQAKVKTLLLAAATLALVAAANLSPAIAQGPKLAGAYTWPAIPQRVDTGAPS